MRALIFAALVLAPTLAATPARAQAASSSASAQAEKVFKEGRAAANAGDFTTARARFLDSERLDPAPGTLLNVADCEVHLGMLVAAREHFELAASGFPRGDNRRAWAASQAAQLDKRLAHLTLRLSPDAPAGTTVNEGGAAVDPASLGHAVAVDPGKVEIMVTAPGRAPKTTTLALGEGQSVEQSLAVGDPAVASEPAPPAPAPPEANAPAAAPTTTHPYRTLGYAIGGLGGAGLVVGSVAGILALGKASTMKSHCNTTTWACDAQGEDAASSGGTLAIVSDVGLIAGAVLAGAGAYFIFSSRDDTPSAVLVPYADPHGAGAAFSRSF